VLLDKGEYMESGFYKIDYTGELLYAPNFVEHKDYQLYAHLQQLHTYPVDGWHWFDSEEEARLHFNLPINTKEE